MLFTKKRKKEDDAQTLRSDGGLSSHPFLPTLLHYPVRATRRFISAVASQYAAGWPDRSEDPCATRNTSCGARAAIARAPRAGTQYVRLEGVVVVVHAHYAGKGMKFSWADGAQWFGFC